MELLWMDERFLYALQRSEVKEEVVVEVVVVLGEDVEVVVVVLAEVGVVEVVDLAEVGVVEVDSVAEEEAEVGNLFVKLDNFGYAFTLQGRGRGGNPSRSGSIQEYSGKKISFGGDED